MIYLLDQVNFLFLPLKQMKNNPPTHTHTKKNPAISVFTVGSFFVVFSELLLSGNSDIFKFVVFRAEIKTTIVLQVSTVANPKTKALK